MNDYNNNNDDDYDYDEENNLSKEEIETLEKYHKTINDLTLALIKKRDEAVAFRSASGIERRWREDEKLFEGDLDGDLAKVDMLDYATQEAPIRDTNSPARSMVEVNVVRSKCETAEGRFSDIMLPTDKRNWDLEPTPVPDLVKSLKDDRIAADINSGQMIKKENGEPKKISEIAQDDMAKAKNKMKAMTREIADQLTECQYNAELRKVIKKSSRLGTGIIKGPNTVKNIKKSYQQKTDGTESIYVLTAVEEHEPESEEVSCWNLYPDPDTDENVKKSMGHIFERSNARPKELLDLINVPGYLPDQIKKVLKEKPVRTVVDTHKDTQKHYTKRLIGDYGDLYERWDFYGELNCEDLEALGIDTSLYPEAYTLSACVVIVNEHPIKVMLNTLDSGDLPYDFFQWSQVSGSPWGVSLARMMLWLQRIINGAMRAMMDNAGDSSGVNVIIGSDIEPVDQKWELTGKKLWKYIGEDPQEIDVRKLFAQFQVTNNQAELQNIIELAFRLLDLETGVPMIFQGEQQKVPETLGATNIMVDSNNVTLRSRAKIFDDQITVPHLSKYYHWNMQYNPKEEIKGDYKVMPLGVSALIQREQNFQLLMQILPYKNDPDFNLRIDWDEAIKKGFGFLGFDILRKDDEFEKKLKEFQEAQKKKPQVDPRVESAKIKAESDIAEIQAKAEADEKEMIFKATEKEKDREHQTQMKLIERDIKMMDFANKQNISLDQIKGKLSSDSMKLQTQISLTDKSGKAPQVTKPAVEPPGRAPDGKAFIK